MMRVPVLSSMTLFVSPAICSNLHFFGMRFCSDPGTAVGSKSER